MGYRLETMGYAIREEWIGEKKKRKKKKKNEKKKKKIWFEIISKIA